MNLQPDRPVVVDVRHLNRSAEAVTRAQPLTSYHGICTEHDRPVRYEADQDCGPKAKIPCRESGHLIDGDRLVAVKTNVTCDGSCQAAVSDRCSCGCGGANHGLMWMWQMAVQLGADPRGILDGAPLGTRREVLETELEKWRARQRQAQARKPQQAERRREAAVRRARVTFEAWAEQHKDTIAALTPFRNDSGDNFLQSLAIQVTDGWNGKPKPLSEAQEAAVFRAIEGIGRRQRQQAEREAARRPAPEGKARIAGRVVRVTYRRRDRDGEELRFGPEHRMVVSCEGYAVQVTVPAEVARWARDNRRAELNRGWRGDDDDYAIASRWTDALRGLNVALTTTVSRSPRDESFGFGKGIAGVQIQAPEPQAGPARQREAEAE